MGVAEEVVMADDDVAKIRFTDEEAAFLRHVRFGELPARVLPEERVELVETEARRDVPESVDFERAQMTHWGGGA